MKRQKLFLIMLVTLLTLCLVVGIVACDEDLSDPSGNSGSSGSQSGSVDNPTGGGNDDGQGGSGTVNPGGDVDPDHGQDNPVDNNQDAPIAYFSFDSLDSNGNYYNEADGRAAASFGNPIQDNDGKNGSAVYFDGESYLSLKEDLPRGNSAHTIAAWVMLDYSIIGNNTENCIAGWGNYTHLQDTRLMIYHKQYCVTSYDVYAMYPLVKNADINWYHVALTYDGYQYTFYLNGVECAVATASEGINIQDSFLYIGGFNDGLKFGGFMDDLYVFDKALDRNDLVKCMNNTYEFEKHSADNQQPETGAANVFDAATSVLEAGVNEFVYENDSCTVPFEIVMPDNYDSSKEYPLMLFLHGDGSNGSTPKAVRLGGEATLVRRSLVESGEDFIAIIPCASSPWLVVPNDTNTVYPYRSYSMDDATPSDQLLAVVELLNDVIDNLAVDEDRVYLAGYSRGTMASWYLLSEMPEKFAACVVCSGAGDPSISYKFANVPLWLFMGDADSLVDLNGIKSIFDNYQQSGGNGVFSICRNGGHGLEAFLYAENNLVEWVFSKERSSSESVVYADYQIKQILVDESLNETEYSSITKEAIVGLTVSTEQSIVAGYTFDAERSSLSGVVAADGSLQLTLYYNQNPRVFNTKGQVKASALYGGAGASDWTVDTSTGTYTSNTANDTLLTFADWKFNGGIIEWDMMVPTDSYKWNTSIGILFSSVTESVVGGNAATDSYYVFGRAFTSEYVGFHKYNGEFGWEDVAKISPSDTYSCPAGETHHFKLEWNPVLKVMIMTYGDNVVTMSPRSEITGEYFGLYSEVQGTVFSNIVVTPREYLDGSSLTLCNTSNYSVWKDSDGKIGYTSLTNSDASAVGVAILKDLSLTRGRVEWDMMVPSEAYCFNVNTGILWGISGDSLNIHTDEYHVSGRYPGGVYVSFSKYLADGSIAFDWENTQEIHDATTMAKGVSAHYAFEYDGENMTISLGGQTLSFALKHNLGGTGIGLYSEVIGTEFYNIVVTPA